LSAVKHNYPDHVVKAAEVGSWQTGCSCSCDVNGLSLIWFCRCTVFCKAVGSHSGTAEETSRPWFDALLVGVWFPVLGWSVFICLQGVAVREELKMWGTASPVRLRYVPIWILRYTADRTSNLKYCLLCKSEHWSVRKQCWHRSLHVCEQYLVCETQRTLFCM